MGLLTTKAERPINILLQHGFEAEGENVTRELHYCYERGIRLSSDYYAYVAVSTETREVVVYVERSCGGEVATYNTTLTSSWYDEEKFFLELDRYVTAMLGRYVTTMLEEFCEGDSNHGESGK